LEAFLVSTGIVAVAEFGDKTQVATVALAARYASVPVIVAGTTLGMLIAY
jgi:putative Ca2+/H+ antiporter (TMEM165/GDT1 family)